VVMEAMCFSETLHSEHSRSSTYIWLISFYSSELCVTINVA
jgi:hypothetical protein